MPKNNENTFRYDGFTNPNYTQVPDDVFDVIAPELTEAELRVLLYIVRRTFGFKKDRDAISLTQMVEGIRARDGRVLDKGTGMSRRGVMKGCAGLIEKGIVTVEKRMSDQGDNEINIYSLHFCDTHVVGNVVPYGREPSAPRVGNQVAPQETVEQKTDFNHSRIRKTSSPKKTIQETSPASTTAPTSTVPSTPPPDPAAMESAGSILKRRTPPRPTYDDDRDRILAYLQDISRLLNDQAPLQSSVTRAYHLYQQSGKPIEVFCELLYQARAITQERSASIRGQGSSTGRGGPRKGKVGYFFAVLEDLLGLKPPDDHTTYPKGSA